MQLITNQHFTIILDYDYQVNIICKHMTVYILFIYNI